MRTVSKAFVGFALVVVLLGAGVAAPVVRAQPAPCADLTATNIAFTPAMPIKDQSATVSITVKNQGSCATLGFGVQWKPTPLTPPLGAQVAGLGAGASTTVSFTYIFLAAGNLVTEAIVDSSRTIPEANELNNNFPKLVTVLRDGIDLQVTGITFAPTNPVQGRVAQVTIAVQNFGLGHAEEFVVQWKPAPLAADLSAQINGLASGAATSLTFNYTYAFFGEFTTSATADSTRRVRESDETNNTLSQTVIVEPPRPDLVITSLTVGPPSTDDTLAGAGSAAEAPADVTVAASGVVEGLPTVVTVVVKNQGNTPAGEFLVSWKPTLFAPDLSKQVDSLAVGASVVVTFDYTYPSAGEFLSLATADPTRRELELDEDNNTKFLLVTVDVATVDLLITDLSVTPTQPTQGLAATVRVTVANQGNSPSGPFVVEWDADSLRRLARGPYKLSQQVADLGPGNSTQIVFTFVYPEQGNFLSLARADAANNIRETNEENNLASLTVTVKPGIDLIITSFTINPASPVRASPATASITVKNQGVWPAEAFFVQWKPDQDGFGGPTAQVDGLAPGQSTTVTLEGSYFKTDTFTSLASVDTFNQVIESDENNNTSTRSVTVKQRETKVRLTFNSVHVSRAGEDGIDGNAEWTILFLVFDPNSSCNFRGQTIDSFQCYDYTNGGVEDGDNLGINKSFEVTLVESTPLLLGSLALESDDFIGIPTGATFMGLTLKTHTKGDHWGEGTRTVASQDGEGCTDGNCYQVNYTVTILSEPPAAPLDAELAAGEIRIPARLSRLFPPDAALPAGVMLTWEVYMPVVTK